MEAPDRVYIERHVKDYPLTKKIISRLPMVPLEFVDDYRTIGEGKPLPIRALEDKDSLALAEKKGEVLKKVGRMESGQYYLFHEIDCKYDCEYCYLQYYFQTKVPVIFVNRDEILSKIEEVLNSHPNPYFHVGEVCDALAFDPLTDFSLEISDLFSRYQNGVIEFRTKSTNVANLLLSDCQRRNLIPSWTLSPERVVSAVEHKTPSLKERLDAARMCQDAGYEVGVRLDPVIMYGGWEEDYRGLVEQVFIRLDPRRIDYISLGTIKLHKLLVDAVRSRFPESPTVTAELFPSVDGKYRYLKFQRVDVYRKMVSWIRGFDASIAIDLSIETDEVRELVFKQL